MAIAPGNLIRSYCIAAAVILAGLTLQAEPSFAQEKPTPKLVQQNGDDGPGDQLHEEDSPEKKKQKRLVEIGFILLVGIGMLGGLLIVIILVLGFFSRRRVQTGKKEPTKFDPFWYLRGNAGVGDEADVDEPQDSTSEPDHDD